MEPKSMRHGAIWEATVGHSAGAEMEAAGSNITGGHGRPRQCNERHREVTATEPKSRRQQAIQQFKKKGNAPTKTVNNIRTERF